MRTTIFAALAVASALTLNAGTIMFGGSTTGAPTWNRPLEALTGLSPIGTAVPYVVTGFTVDQADFFTFDSTATLGWDNFLFLYELTFDPLDPLTNALIADDDNPIVGLSGFSLNLLAGTQYYLVTTGFGNTNFGDFTNTISANSGTAVLDATVPEPSTLFVAGAGLSLLGLARRRRKT